MDVHAGAAAKLDTELTDGLEERQRFDVADRAADLDHADISAVRTELHAALDLVRDVRNDLDGGAQVVATALFRDDALVDAAGGEIAVAARHGAHEALVVAQIQVGFRAVVRDEHFAVLERAHGARVHVDVGVELDHRHLEAASLEDGAQRGRGDALAQRGHDAAGDENETRQGGEPLKNRLSRDSRRARQHD